MSRTACGRQASVPAFPHKEGDDFAPGPRKNACRGRPLRPPVLAFYSRSIMRGPPPPAARQHKGLTSGRPRGRPLHQISERDTSLTRRTQKEEGHPLLSALFYLPHSGMKPQTGHSKARQPKLPRRSPWRAIRPQQGQRVKAAALSRTAGGTASRAAISRTVQPVTIPAITHSSASRHSPSASLARRQNVRAIRIFSSGVRSRRGGLLGKYSFTGAHPFR